jgi:heterodisulfide reductase subunit A
MVTLTIDGRKVEIDEGKTIVDAAKELGIKIPTLCYNPMIEPYAACRICSVEIVRGKRSRIVTACNYPATEGLEVFTNNERVRAIRKTILELMLARCTDVPALMELAEEYGLDEFRFGRGKEECILCGLCVRVCDEIVGANAIAFSNRGADREVTPPFGTESEACIGCGACAFVCPTGAIKLEELEGRKIIHEDLRLGPEKAISVPFLQAVPNAPVIDAEACIHFITGECGTCEKVCEPEAIVYEEEEKEQEVDVGSIIVATGFKQFDPSEMQQFGYGRLRNVVTALEFERMNCAAGVTGGKIFLTDGRTPQSVGIIHCVGSRDKNYHEYCSRVCCMYALKYAHLIKEKTDAEVYNFYIDLRCFGKGYEEFYHRLLDEGVRFIRGKAAEVTDFPIYKGEEGKLIVKCEDTLVGAVRRVPLDMVILCSALESQQDAADVARIFSCSLGKDGFFIEKHPKLAPVSTNADGIFIAGACQGPKDIPDSVAQGAAAASQALSLIMKGRVEIEAAVAFIDEDKCSGCRICNELCPYSAIDFDEEKKVSVVNDALCKGCGTCVAACPRAAIKGKHFTDQQIMSEIEGITV